MNTNWAQLIQQVEEGNEIARNELARLLLDRAILSARLSFPVSPSGMVDAEDIAASAVKSLCRRIDVGDITYQGDAEIGGLLKKFVRFKATKYLDREFAGKRDRRRTIAEHDLINNQGQAVPMAEIVSRFDESIVLDDGSVLQLSPEDEQELAKVATQVSPEVVNMLKEVLSRLDPKPKTVMLLLMERKLTNKELAKELDCAPSSIERYRASIRRTYQKFMAEEEEV